MSNAYFQATTDTDGVVDFLLGEDVNGVFVPYELLFKRGDDLYIARDQIRNELVACYFDGARDIGIRTPYLPHMSISTFVDSMGVLQ